MIRNLVNGNANIAAAIPDDIFYLIFIEGYHISLVRQNGKEPDPSRYLLAISQTCSRFRNISVSCTLLWARVHVEWPPNQRRLWVQRSGTRELDIRCGPFRTPRAGSIADTPGDIFESFYKWRTLRFTRTSKRVIEDVLKTVVPTPVLGFQSIDLRCDTLEGITSETHSLDERLWPKITSMAERRSFPNLQKIRFWRTPHNLWGMLDNVVTLDVHMSHYSWNHWCRLLQQAKVLEELFLDIDYYSVDPQAADDHGVPVTLDRLRSLELRKGNAVRFRKFFSDVTAPSLDNLSISLPTTYDLNLVTWERTQQAFLEFVSFSDPSSPP